MTPTGSEPGADFDRWLRRQLRSALDPELGPRPHPATARYAAASRQTGGRVTPFRFSIAALGAKALVGGAVVALAAGTAGTVMTGSVNPTTWGQHISEFVELCKAKDVNVGECVSDQAQMHGKQVRAQHSEAVENAAASPSPKPGQREGQDNSQSKGGNGAAASDGHGQSQGHVPASPVPTPSDHGQPHGKPSPSS
jgi:hypothetical protein